MSQYGAADAVFNAGSADTGYSFELPAATTNDDVVALYEDALPGFEIDGALEVEPGESLNDRYGVTIVWDDGEISFISGDPGLLSVQLGT